MEAWLDLFLQEVDQHVPIKQLTVKHKNQPRWMSPEILEEMKCRDRHKSLDNDDEYKVWRNKVIKMIQHAKLDMCPKYTNALLYILAPGPPRCMTQGQL